MEQVVVVLDDLRDPQVDVLMRDLHVSAQPTLILKTSSIYTLNTKRISASLAGVRHVLDDGRFELLLLLLGHDVNLLFE
jgi:hypothetical protein